MTTENPGTPALDPANPPAAPLGDQPLETVPKSAYEEMKADLLKQKQIARERERELELQKQKTEELKLQGLKAKEDYKAMYEDAENRFKDVDTKYKQTQSAIVDSTKWNAVSAEMVAIGLSPAVLRDVEKLIDYGQIDIEWTSTGRVSVTNAKAFAEQFKAQRPFYFQGHKGPNLNPNTPTVMSPLGVDYAAVKAAEAQYYKTRSPEDEKKYREVLMAYKAKH